MNLTDSILFSDLEKIFPSEILCGDVSVCKRITIPTRDGNLILQVGDTDDHYNVSFEKTHHHFCNACGNQIDSIFS